MSKSISDRRTFGAMLTRRPIVSDRQPISVIFPLKENHTKQQQDQRPKLQGLQKGADETTHICIRWKYQSNGTTKSKMHKWLGSELNIHCWPTHISVRKSNAADLKGHQRQRTATNSGKGLGKILMLSEGEREVGDDEFFPKIPSLV